MRRCKKCPGPQAQEIQTNSGEKQSQKVTTLFKKKSVPGKKKKL